MTAASETEASEVEASTRAASLPAAASMFEGGASGLLAASMIPGRASADPPPLSPPQPASVVRQRTMIEVRRVRSIWARYHRRTPVGSGRDEGYSTSNSSASTLDIAARF